LDRKIKISGRKENKSMGYSTVYTRKIKREVWRTAIFYRLGAFILIEKDDKYWSDRLSEKAFYFHKFVVTNEFAGMGYSKIILDWVKNYGKQMGKEYIRLDFNESREYLKQLYYGNGFIKVRVYEENDKHKLVLAEIKI